MGGWGRSEVEPPATCTLGPPVGRPQPPTSSGVSRVVSRIAACDAESDRAGRLSGKHSATREVLQSRNVVEIRTASDHARVGVLNGVHRVSKARRRRHVRSRTGPVETPFGGVSQHVEQAKVVRLQRPNRSGFAI